MINLLIAEENSSKREELKLLLKSVFNIYEADNGLEALDICKREQISFYLINSKMPFITDKDFLSKFDALSVNPVIVYGDNVQHIKEQFEYVYSVSDDTLSIVNLINILKDNYYGESNDPRFYKYQGIELDYYAKKLKIDGEELKLTPKELDLFIFLTINEGSIFSREDLLTKVWGYEFLGDSRTIDTHVKSLRSKLRDYRNLIITIWGKGYKSEKPKNLR